MRTEMCRFDMTTESRIESACVLWRATCIVNRPGVDERVIGHYGPISAVNHEAACRMVGTAMATLFGLEVQRGTLEVTPITINPQPALTL